MTLEEFWALPDDGKHYELLEGELYVSPSPVLAHQTVVVNLTGLLWVFLNENRIGFVLTAPFDVILSKRNVYEPDVLFVSRERSPEIVKDGRIHGAPDLAVEVLSPSSSSRDHVRKRLGYERFGVLEYWIVDPEERTLVRYAREGDRFGSPELHEGDSTIATSLLPGFTFALPRLFTSPIA